MISVGRRVAHGCSSPERTQGIESLLWVMGMLNVATLMPDSLTRQTTEAVRRTRLNIPAAAFKIESEEVDSVTSEHWSSSIAATVMSRN